MPTPTQADIDSFEAQQAKWRDIVGGFILAFGDVEVITYGFCASTAATKCHPIGSKCEPENCCRCYDERSQATMR